MKTQYKYYADPSHGWVAVDIKTLNEIGIKPIHITSYSYVSKSGKTVYLEEDCDLPQFINFYKRKTNSDPVFVEKYTDNRSPIRSYPSHDTYKGSW